MMSRTATVSQWVPRQLSRNLFSCTYDFELASLDARRRYYHRFCVLCGLPSVHAHHIVYRTRAGERGDTISLCEGCHCMVRANLIHFKADRGLLWFQAFPNPIKLSNALLRGSWMAVDTIIEAIMTT